MPTILGQVGHRRLVDSTVGAYTGRAYYVDPSVAVSGTGRPTSPMKTIQAAHDAASAGDTLVLAPGSYDEEVTLSKNNILVIAPSGRGSAFVAPSGSNKTAVTVTGDDVTLINVGCEGDGTGGGLHLQATTRFRAHGCKIEGGAVACKLESLAASAVGDTIFEDCEFAWATDGVNFVVTGGGDPVTQTRFINCLFHNIVTAGIEAVTTHTADCWLVDCVFAAQEDGTEPTDYLLLNVASTTGLVTGCRFATATNAATTLNIAAGVFWMANATNAGWSTAVPV